MKPISIALATLCLTAFTAHAEFPNTVFSGDFRFRNERIDDAQTSGSIITMQQRIRARLSIKANLADDLISELRVASGPGRNTTNQTLGASSSAFGNLGILLDRAYMKWEFTPGFQLWAGRMANPDFCPAASDLIWDNDLNFDGTAITAEQKLQDTLVFETASLDWASKSSSNPGQDIVLNTFQIGAKQKHEKVKIEAGLSYHTFSNLVYSNALQAFFGNSSIGNKYKYDFRILEVGADAEMQLFNNNFTLLADFAKNEATPENSDGYLVGFKFGRSLEAHDWQLNYDYRIVGKDSVIGSFADNDGCGGGADLQSHRIVVAYRPKRNLSVATLIFVGKKSIAVNETATKYNRLMFDLSMNF